MSIAGWLGIVVLALDNLDTGLPRSEGLEGGWPFFLAVVAITIIVAIYLARRTDGPADSISSSGC